MCGLAGYLGLDDASLLADMAARMAHRGPDGEGLWRDGDAGVGLAHRRLAIIDPTAAASQPMASCEGRYHVVFNGEIYNFREIADELLQSGYALNAHSDTAVLGPLFDRMGVAMLERLNGIFAIAIWDAKTRELFIARDAFGVKPLYYARTARGLLFASELKALIACSGLDRNVDVAAVEDYLVRLWSPGERTPFRSVKKLPPGHFMRARLDHFEIADWRGPTPRGRSDERASAANVAERLAGLFDVAVADQCLSDVPVGAFLSGGVDSSAVVASMVATGNRPQRAYCIGFQDASFADEGFGDDLCYARRVAAKLDVELSPIIVAQPSASDVENLAYMLDEPQADLAPLYIAAISRAARADGVKVLLGGAGGDDIFSGYRRHKAAAARARLGGAARALSLAPTEAFASFLSKPLRRRLEKLRYMFAGGDEEFLLRSFEFNPRDSALDILAPRASAGGVRDGDALAQAAAATRGLPLLDRMLALELSGFLPDHNLNYTDKASMAHGVEVRVPFLDARLVAFAQTIPWRFKTTLFDEKWIFKQSQAKRLPAGILGRKKTGFGAPLRGWIAGSMNEMFRDLFASRAFRERGLFDPRAVDRLLDDTVSGQRDGAYLVLAVLMIEFWLRRFGGATREAEP